MDRWMVLSLWGFIGRDAMQGYNHVYPTGLLEIQEGFDRIKRDEKQNPEGMK
jgi:hypothetical protein